MDTVTEWAHQTRLHSTPGPTWMAASLVGPIDSPELGDADRLDDRAPETATSVLLRPGPRLPLSLVNKDRTLSHTRMQIRFGMLKPIGRWFNWTERFLIKKNREVCFLQKKNRGLYNCSCTLISLNTWNPRVVTRPYAHLRLGPIIWFSDQEKKVPCGSLKFSLKILSISVLELI